MRQPPLGGAEPFRPAPVLHPLEGERADKQKDRKRLEVLLHAPGPTSYLDLNPCSVVECVRKDRGNGDEAKQCERAEKRTSHGASMEQHEGRKKSALQGKDSDLGLSLIHI